MCHRSFDQLKTKWPETSFRVFRTCFQRNGQINPSLSQDESYLGFKILVKKMNNKQTRIRIFSFTDRQTVLQAWKTIRSDFILSHTNQRTNLLIEVYYIFYIYQTIGHFIQIKNMLPFLLFLILSCLKSIKILSATQD